MHVRPQIYSELYQKTWDKNYILTLEGWKNW